MKQTNRTFILPAQPNENDKSPRNAFGYCKGFGVAYSEYYDMQDKIKNEGFLPKLRQAISEAHPREVRLLAVYITDYLSENKEETNIGERIAEAIEAYGGGAE